MKAEHANNIAKAAAELSKAITASQRCSEARAAISPYDSRARLTTANARWARAAEYRERCYGSLLKAIHEADCWPAVKESLSACSACKESLQDGAP